MQHSTDKDINDLLDLLVSIRAGQNIPFHLISSSKSLSYDALKVSLKILKEYSLIEEDFIHSTTFYTVTTLGYKVQRENGFINFRNEHERIKQRAEEKDEIEYQLLKQSKKLKPYEFWLLVLGSILGFLGFIMSLLQYLKQ